MAMDLQPIPHFARAQSLAELMHPFLVNQQMQQQTSHNAVMNPYLEHMKQVESQYAPQNAEAKLRDLLAHTGYLGAETSAIPQRLGLQQGQLDVSRGNLDLSRQQLADLIRRNPNEQIQANIQNTLSQTEKNKALADKAHVASGIGLDQESGGPLTLYTPANRTQAQKQYDTAQQLINHIEDLKKYGTEGTQGVGIAGTPAYTWYHSDTANKGKYEGTKNQSLDKFIALQNLRATDKTLKTADKTMGRQSYETPAAYIDRMDQFKAQAEERKNNLGKFLGRGGIPLEKNASKSSMPEGLAAELKKRGLG